jgi:hypothetical protein
MGIYQTGKNNPNYGNNWSEEQRQKASNYFKSISHKISERVKEDWANDEERKQRASELMSQTMSQMIGEKNHFYNKTHTEETKNVIGNKSKNKFTIEYNNSYRKTMEDRGHWIPLDQKPEKEIYFKESNWINKMFDIVPNGIQLLNEHGMFHCSLNKNGVVRDHIVGRKHGFEIKVFPEIMRHPCNCQIITHKENISKGQKGKNRPDRDIEIKELFERIKSYNGKWLEQKLVLSLIKDYESGKRWKLRRSP